MSCGAGLLNSFWVAQSRNAVCLGGVVERLMAPVLKTGRAKVLVGSNPTPSANPISDFRFPISDWGEDPVRDEVRRHKANESSADDIR